MGFRDLVHSSLDVKGVLRLKHNIKAAITFCPFGQFISKTGTHKLGLRKKKEFLVNNVG